MNDTISSIMERRSVRSYKQEQVEKEKLDIILDCGLHAPSAMNTQNWHFTVVQSVEIIAEMNEEIKYFLTEPAKQRAIFRNNGSEDYSIFHKAPTVIVVSGDVSDDWSITNCALATQNICLAAHSLGVGTCIIGLAKLLFNSEKGDKWVQKLGVTSGYRPLYGISIGYCAGKMPVPEYLHNRVTYL